MYFNIIWIALVVLIFRFWISVQTVQTLRAAGADFRAAAGRERILGADRDKDSAAGREGILGADRDKDSAAGPEWIMGADRDKDSADYGRARDPESSRGC